MKLTYLLVNFLTIIVPLIFSFHPKLKFYKYFKPLSFSICITALLFIAWDIYFTAVGVWGFNRNYIMELYFFNLPIEEVLFFFCIPFACVFTYHCLNKFFKIQWPLKIEVAFVMSFSVLLLGAGIIFNAKLYTSWTFISLGFVLLMFKYLLKINWLAKLVLIYPFLLIPFFIVNGVLTGSGIDEPVVWYNNTENLGLRMFTIPFEDVFYGFELILLNIFFYEYFKSKYFKDTIANP